MRDKVNLADKLRGFDDTWAPRIVADYNGNDIMVVKVQGAFVWHAHPDSDDLFPVLSGEVDIELRGRIVTLAPGELFVAPRGVEHRPVSRGGAELLLFEPRGTPNTGDTATAAAKHRI